MRSNLFTNIFILQNMKRKILLFIALASLIGAVHLSCKKEDDCIRILHKNGFSFNLINRFGNELIGAWGRPYLSDSTFLTNSDGSLPSNLAIQDHGSIGFAIHTNSKLVTDSLYFQQYYLYLPDFDGKPYQDTDTISIAYIFERKGDYLCYNSYKVTYNDSIYYDGNFSNVFRFIK
jgi:hypothetical protein